jgi:hypothetical protein
MKIFIRRLFCRHDFLVKRTPIVLEETGEVYGVIVEETCKKCGARKTRLAI